MLLSIAGLAMLSAGSLAYAFLYGRIQNENRIQQRLGFVQGENAGDTGAGPRTRTGADAAKRRKSVQDSLNELDLKQKALAKRPWRSPWTAKNKAETTSVPGCFAMSPAIIRQ